MRGGGFLVNIFSVGVDILLCHKKPTLNIIPDHGNSDFRQKAKEGTTSNIKEIAWKEE